MFREIKEIIKTDMVKMHEITENNGKLLSKSHCNHRNGSLVATVLCTIENKPYVCLVFNVVNF